MSDHTQCQIRDVVRWMEALAPPSLAEEWDRVGLQVGAIDRRCQQVLTCLEVTLDIVQEAVARHSDLIIAHHPFLFRPLGQVRWDEPKGRVLRELIQNDISVYAAHTNLDNADGGLNDWLAASIGLEKTKVFDARTTEALYKLVVFVPLGDEDAVRRAAAAVGAGIIGNYRQCSFESRGTGTFLPGEGAKPYVGSPGQLTRADEVRLEMVVYERDKDSVVAAVLDTHPYEEAAFDLYRLANGGRTFGTGRTGELVQQESLAVFVDRVKRGLGLEQLRVVGGLDTLVRKVVVYSGSGGGIVPKATEMGADVLVTGDVKYHEAVDATAAGLTVVDAGHFGTEHIVARGLAQQLGQWADVQGLDLTVVAAESQRDPFRHM